MWDRVLFLSATPGPFELEQCQGAVVEQIIRPTGLVDPPIEVLPARGQVPDLLERIRVRAAAMRSCGALIGGEGNGGVILPKVTYVRDSLVAMALTWTHRSGQSMRTPS